MLMLLLHIGKDVYAVDCDRVVEVVPLVVLKGIPHAPTHLAGVFDYRGRIVPVVDLCVILARRPCAIRLSSRIVLVTAPVAGGGNDLVGLLAERVTETVKKEPGDFARLRDELDVMPYLGGISTGPGGMIQELLIDNVLANAVPSRWRRGEALDDHGGPAPAGAGERSRP